MEVGLVADASMVGKYITAGTCILELIVALLTDRSSTG